MTRPSAELRRQVIELAHDRCEYCRVPQILALATHQVDHVIAEKHGGETILSNLALSCAVCNRRKGSDIGSLDPVSRNLTALFHPRAMNWVEHFEVDGAEFLGKTSEARTTIEFLKLNAPDRLAERRLILLNGWDIAGLDE